MEEHSVFQCTSECTKAQAKTFSTRDPQSWSAVCASVISLRVNHCHLQLETSQSEMWRNSEEKTEHASTTSDSKSMMFPCSIYICI